MGRANERRWLLLLIDCNNDFVNSNTAKKIFVCGWAGFLVALLTIARHYLPHALAREFSFGLRQIHSLE